MAKAQLPNGMNRLTRKETWTTTDGRTFDDEDTAAAHEDHLIMAEALHAFMRSLIIEYNGTNDEARKIANIIIDNDQAIFNILSHKLG